MSNTVKPDGYNTPIPAKIMTPDRVETRIGTLEFNDGFPTEQTAELLYDHLDFLRGVEAFLVGVPAASLEAMCLGMTEFGVAACHQVLIVERAARLEPAVPDRQHRHGLCDGHPRPRARRSDGLGDPARVWTYHGQRRLVPVHHRHGQAGPRPRSGRQVPHPAPRLRRVRPGRVLRVGVAVVGSTGWPCVACSSTASPTRRPSSSRRVSASTRSRRSTTRRRWSSSHSRGRSSTPSMPTTSGSSMS